MAPVKAIELVVSGDVQKVGYRWFVTKIARKLKLVGFAENLEDGTVKIQCKGEMASICKFKELINVKNPPQASLIEVENITETTIRPEQVTGTAFKEKFGTFVEELVEGADSQIAYLASWCRSS